MLQKLIENLRKYLYVLSDFHGGQFSLFFTKLRKCIKKALQFCIKFCNFFFKIVCKFITKPTLIDFFNVAITLEQLTFKLMVFNFLFVVEHNFSFIRSRNYSRLFYLRSIYDNNKSLQCHAI